MGRPRKYATEEERREARCQRNRKYYNANREAINGRRVQAFKKKRPAIGAGQKETWPEREDPRAGSRGGEMGLTRGRRVEPNTGASMGGVMGQHQCRKNAVRR